MILWLSEIGDVRAAAKNWEVAPLGCSRDFRPMKFYTANISDA